MVLTIVSLSLGIKLSKMSINHLSSTSQKNKFGESFEIFSMISLVIDTTFLFLCHVGRSSDHLLVTYVFFSIWLLIKIVHIVSFSGSKRKSCGVSGV